MDLVANYVDYNSQQAVSAVLRWCDTAGLFLLSRLEGAIQRQLLEQWSRYAVMRSIKVEMKVLGAEWDTWRLEGLMNG